MLTLASGRLRIKALPWCQRQPAVRRSHRRPAASGAGITPRQVVPGRSGSGDWSEEPNRQRRLDLLHTRPLTLDDDAVSPRFDRRSIAAGILESAASEGGIDSGQDYGVEEFRGTGRPGTRTRHRCSFKTTCSTTHSGQSFEEASADITGWVSAPRRLLLDRAGLARARNVVRGGRGMLRMTPGNSHLLPISEMVPEHAML